MYLQIKTINLSPDKFGNQLSITKVGLYDENGKWIKWVKLDGKVLNLLCNTKIYGYYDI